MLTRLERKLLGLIITGLADDGFAPSFDEMSEKAGLHSRGNVHRVLTNLEQKGYIRRLKQRARAIEIVRLPEDMASEPSHMQTQIDLLKAENAMLRSQMQNAMAAE